MPKGTNTTAWAAITCLVGTGTTFVRLFSQTAVLMGVLREQRDGFLLSLLSFAGDLTYLNLTVASIGQITGGGRLPLLLSLTHT